MNEAHDQDLQQVISLPWCSQTHLHGAPRSIDFFYVLLLSMYDTGQSFLLELLYVQCRKEWKKLKKFW